jgi:hypothetical protein
LGWVSAIDAEGRTIWIADAHRGDGERFVVHADEKLTAFVELESAICACGDCAFAGAVGGSSVHRAGNEGTD